MPMIRPRLVFVYALLLICAFHAGCAPSARAHGSVTAEGDVCLIRIGFYTAHFKVFQPETSRQREFCEDLPDAGESIFVMEYLHQGLTDATIEFRIVQDVTGFGPYARLEDLESITDLDAITVFHQPPAREPQVFTVLHNFIEAGDFLGIVTVHNPHSGQPYAALFPFSVGGRGWGLLPLFAALAVLTQLMYWLSTRRPRLAAKPGAARAAGVLLLPLVVLLGASSPAEAEAEVYTSASGALQLSLAAANPRLLNQISEWTLHLETSAGDPLANARIEVTGGMPAHDHGLATQPVVSAMDAPGSYRLKGLRFHMQGAWVLTLAISYADTTDTIVVPLTI